MDYVLDKDIFWVQNNTNSIPEGGEKKWPVTSSSR